MVMPGAAEELGKWDKNIFDRNDAIESRKAIVRAQQEATRRAQLELAYNMRRAKAEETAARAARLNARVGASRHVMEATDYWKPTLIIALSIILLAGAGSAAIMQLVYSLNIWAWLAILFGAILIWRNYKK